MTPGRTRRASPVSSGRDDAPGAAALASGSVGIAWQSDRSGNPDIWFGSPGEREDLNPPPYIEWIDHRPAPNPDSDDPITFRARAGTRRAWPASAWCGRLMGSRRQICRCSTTARTATTGPATASGVSQHAPLPAGSQVTYRARATDTDGNSLPLPGPELLHGAAAVRQDGRHPLRAGCRRQ